MQHYAIDVPQHICTGFYLLCADYHIWQWEDEHGNWNPYDATITLALEKGHQGGSTNVAIVACHRAYTVDLGSMQQVNDATKVKRKIDRVKSGLFLFQITLIRLVIEWAPLRFTQ